MTEVDVAGTTLACDIEGSGPNMLLIHAGIADRRMWDPQWKWLRASYRVARYDQQGYGESPPHAGRVSLSEDVLSVLDAAGMDQAILVAASMGGATAIHVALSHPDRVSALVLIAPGLWGYDPPVPDPPELQASEVAFRQGEYERSFSLDEAAWVVGLRRQRSQMDPIFLAFCREMNRTQLRYTDVHPNYVDDFSDAGHLEDLSMPTLVIVGEEDLPGIAATARTITERAPKASLVTVPHAAHLVNLERPDAFDDVLRPWLEALDLT